MKIVTLMAALRMAIAGLAVVGFLGIANAVPLAPAETSQLTTQDIFQKYVQPVHHRCWWEKKRVAISKYCCGFDYYGACIKHCIQWGHEKVRVCKRHRRYKRRRRYRKRRRYVPTY